jgi:hypothetical protein
VRIWKPKRLDVVRASIVVVLQIGHSGRTWKDMILALPEAGAQHSQSPDGCRFKAGDGAIMAHSNIGLVFCFAHLQKEINDWCTNWSPVRFKLSKIETGRCPS